MVKILLNALRGRKLIIPFYAPLGAPAGPTCIPTTPVNFNFVHADAFFLDTATLTKDSSASILLRDVSISRAMSLLMNMFSLFRSSILMLGLDCEKNYLFFRMFFLIHLLTLGMQSCKIRRVLFPRLLTLYQVHTVLLLMQVKIWQQTVPIRAKTVLILSQTRDIFCVGLWGAHLELMLCSLVLPPVPNPVRD
jgi:hypothetical protein